MKQEFKAVIKQHQNKNAAYIEPPFDVNEVFGAKRVKVKATFDGTPYRGSIVYMGGCYLLGLTQDIRNKIGKGFGDEITVTVEKDVEERSVAIPEDFAEAMKNHENALSNFGTLSFTAQKEFANWIVSAKRPETRLDRIRKAAVLLAEGKKLR